MPATLYLADAAYDAPPGHPGLDARPGAVLLSTDGQILASGTPDVVYRHDQAPSARRIDKPGHILLPGLINAHTHLDLTHIGPRPYDPKAGFVGWVGMVIRERATEPADVAHAVGLGVERCLAGGVLAVGDIAGAVGPNPGEHAVHALLESRLAGTALIEFFGIGERDGQGLEAAADLLDRTPRTGLSPHAPITVSPRAYRKAAEIARSRDIPLITHLAETPEERAFIQHAAGPQRDLLEGLGLWDQTAASDVGHGAHPIDHALDAIATPPNTCTLVHVNDCPNAQLARLACSGVSVVYCPRASAYFGRDQDFGPHRYRDMLEAGINVALGTDSIINLPDRGSSPTLSTFDEARLLFERDNTDPALLLSMITTRGALAIGLDPDRFTLSAGTTPVGLIAVEGATLAEALANKIDPEILYPEITSGFTRTNPD